MKPSVHMRFHHLIFSHNKLILCDSLTNSTTRLTSSSLPSSLSLSDESLFAFILRRLRFLPFFFTLTTELLSDDASSDFFFAARFRFFFLQHMLNAKRLKYMTKTNITISHSTKIIIEGERGLISKHVHYQLVHGNRYIFFATLSCNF